MSLFTACSDDDDAVDYSKVIEEEIAGNYKGTLTVTVDGFPMSPEPQKINIEKASPSAINLSLSKFSFAGFNIGDVELENCVLSQNGDTYTFTGTQNLAVEGLSCTINAKGTITNGTVKVEMDIDAKLDNGKEQSVKVVYEGTRLTGSESSEAKITAFSFDLSNEANAVVIEQPVINDDNTITFRVNGEAVEADANVLKNLVPTFTISDKATASVKSGEAMDLSQDVTITVTAEDGTTIVPYIVKSPIRNSLMKFSLDDWGELQSGAINYPAPNPTNTLATSNAGAALLHVIDSYDKWPVVEETQGFKGSAAKLITLDTRETSAALMGAGVTSGSLFTGKFIMEGSSTIEYTKFGVLYEKKPLYFKGVYKYTPGSPFIETHKKGFFQYEFVETNAIDECAIQAVLYTVADETETLDGTNIDDDNNEKIVARARLEDGTAKDDWTAFNLEFKWKDGVTYDAEKTYKLAIVCSSSKDGANFNGAANSTLIVDELEVIGE